MKQQLPKISIIILNWNGKKDTMECLKSLKKTDYPKKKYEIIIVDNGSHDNSSKIIKKLFPYVKIIRNKKNYGFAEGNNIGAKKAKGNLLVFLNNDTFVEKNWLKNLVKIAINKKIGICTPKIIYQDYKGQKKRIINTAGGGLTWFGVPYLIGRGKLKNEFNKPCLIFWASGCCLMIKKTLFSKLKGFDKSFFLYAEDLDLSWRVWNQGYEVKYVPDSIIYHKEGASIKTAKGKFNKKYYYYQNKNIIKTFIKNSPKKYLYVFLPSRFLLNLMECIIFLFKNVEITKLIMQGTSDGLKAEREKITTKSSPQPYVLLGNLKTTVKELIKKWRRHAI